MIKKYPLAFASILVGLFSFISFFGIEKALIAIFLGVFALKYSVPEHKKEIKYAIAGIVLGSIYIVILVYIAIIKGPEIIELIRKLK